MLELFEWEKLLFLHTRRVDMTVESKSDAVNRRFNRAICHVPSRHLHILAGVAFLAALLASCHTVTRYHHTQRGPVERKLGRLVGIKSPAHALRHFIQY